MSDVSRVTDRGRLALVLIQHHITSGPTRNPPSHSELLELMNQVLPPRLDGRRIVGEALTSKEQTARHAEELRMAGLLVDAPGMMFNMRTTEAGERQARVWRPETEAWLSHEWKVWEQASGRTRKSVQRSTLSGAFLVRKTTSVIASGS